jgi:hypothetical protein
MTRLLLIVPICFVSCYTNNTKNQSSISADSIYSDTFPVEISNNFNTIFDWHQKIDTFYLKDMNGDGVEDTAIVYSPVHAYPDNDSSFRGGCDDDSCVTRVYFSFDNTVLKHKNALGFYDFFVTDDLNSDGFNEVGFIPNWFYSCWSGLFIYSLHGNEWLNIATATVYSCYQSNFSWRVKKINQNRFRIISQKWNADGSEIIDTTKFFKINSNS